MYTEYKVRVYSTDRVEWRNLDNQFHRTDGPAIEYENGDKYWFFNDRRHRADGPAVEWADGYKAWFFNGKRHRADGPAIECASGDKRWYLNGQELTEAEHKAQTQSCEGKIVEVDGKKYKLVEV